MKNMASLAKIRGEIADYFNRRNEAGEDVLSKVFNLSSSTVDRSYSAFYTSKFLIQDATDAILSHHAKGFSKEGCLDYLELLGVLQAVIVQQDSIAILYEVIVGKKLDTRKLLKWRGIRELRNLCAGHPAQRDRPLSQPMSRAFFGRGIINYSYFTYERWQDIEGEGLQRQIDHPEVRLEELLNEYAGEAIVPLREIMQALEAKVRPGT